MDTLITSQTQRQKILDSIDVQLTLKRYLGIVGFFSEGEDRFTKEMVAAYYQVEESSIELLLDSYGEELRRNGYTLFEGKQMEDFKSQFGRFINIDNHASQLGLFNITALMNIGMLLTDNEVAKKVRNKILDIFISALNDKTGGGSRYVNPCEIDPAPDDSSKDGKPLDFDQIINLPENKKVLSRLKQADDDDNDE